MHFIYILQKVDPIDEMKNLIEKQENDISKLRGEIQEKSEEQDKLLQKILRSMENFNSDTSHVQSLPMNFHLKKVQLDNPSDQNSIDDSKFPLLP